MSKIRTIIFTLSILIFSISQGIANEMIGVISAGIGDIYNQKNEKLLNGSKIFYGDTILANSKSNAQILFLDETVMTVGENTELTIDDFIYNPITNDGNFVTNIKSGIVKTISGKISKKNPDNLEVNIPTGSIGARGTEFVVVTESDEKSTVVLLGPGKKNTLGMIPGILNVSDGLNTVNISTPGFQSVVFK